MILRILLVATLAMLPGAQPAQGAEPGVGAGQEIRQAGTGQEQAEQQQGDNKQ